MRDAETSVFLGRRAVGMAFRLSNEITRRPEKASLYPLATRNNRSHLFRFKRR